MSKEDLKAVIGRAFHDGHFSALALTWPDELCGRYALSSDEVEALQSGDRKMLLALGLDARHVALTDALWGRAR